MTLRFSPRAVQDLAAIADYLTARNPKAALAVESRIRATVDLISDLPAAGRKLDQRPTVRVMPTIRYPYLIFYTQAEEGVVVLHVRHASRAPIEAGDL